MMLKKQQTASIIILLLLFILTSQQSTNADPIAGGDPITVSDQIKNKSSIGIKMTQWVDPYGSSPTTYSQWKSKQTPDVEFEIQKIDLDIPINKTRAGSYICVIVNGILYSSTKSAVDRYVQELTGEGYSVKLYVTTCGPPADLRFFLQQEYAEGLEGCVLIGDMAVPWYETDFGDPVEHAEFPIDLFYMDMDGIFTDNDGDDLYDSHTGDVAPEIWLGRLTASTLTLDGADETSLINNYFRKNHLYRTNQMQNNNQGLMYIDDDWAPGNNWDLNMGDAYSNRTFVKDNWQTWDTDYENRLPQNYEFLQVCVHSWSGGHAFKDPNDNWGWCDNWEMKAIAPKAHFYNLFACSNARYVETDYMSGWYIFGQDHGLAAIGCTKSGSMLYFDDFYRPWGDGKSFGESYLEWFQQRAVGGFEEWEITWFYGMTLNGDPTLCIQKKSNNQWLKYDNGSASYMMALHSNTSWDKYNVRFTAEEPCTLSTVTIDGGFPTGSIARVYVWNSDGVFPSTIIDSVDVPSEELGIVNLYDRLITFNEGDEFHIGVSLVDPEPEDTIWVHMDDGNPEQFRSGYFDEIYWQPLTVLYGKDYNFLIRAEMLNNDPNEITITDITLPDGNAGNVYNKQLNCIGGTPPFTWELTAGALPDGLTLNMDNGVISGTSLIVDTSYFSIKVTDSDFPPINDVQHLSLTITPGLCGDANNSGDVNVTDLTYMVNYIFKGGPPPPIHDIADVNSSGDINVADLTYMVNYVFKGGPEPYCL